MLKRKDSSDKKKMNKIFTIFVWILTGIFASLAGTAMMISGSFNLDCFYDSGEVYDVAKTYCNDGVIGFTYSPKQDCLVIAGADATKTFDLSKMQEKWNYIVLKLSQVNTNSLPCRVDFYDKTNYCVAQREYQLGQGENVLEIQNVSYSKVVFHFVNQFDFTFRIDKAQFRETFFSVAKRTILLDSTAIFGIYLLVTVLLWLLLRKMEVKADWYILVSGLQKLYCKIGDSTGSRICRNLSNRMKARLRTLLFCIMILNMHIASVLGLYENNKTYRYEMLANVVILLLVALLCWEKELKHLNWKNKLVGAWLTLWIMAIVSDVIVNKRYAYTGYMMLFVVGFLFFLWGNMEHKEWIIWDFIYAIQWNFLLNALFCFLFRPYTEDYRYSGGSYGPGSWGLYLLFAWCAFLAGLDLALGQKGARANGIVSLAGAGITACFLWKTQSVSSILPALVVALIFSLRWWICRRRKKVLILIASLAVFAGIFELSGYGIYKIPRMVDREIHFKSEDLWKPATSHPLTVSVEAASIENSRIYQKLTSSTSLETLTSGRNLYWEGYLRKMNLWGHENKVFLWGANRKPHNGLLQIMYRYGIFAGIPYIVMILYNLIYAIQYFLKNHSKRGTNFFILAVAIAGTMLLPVENLELPFYWLCWFAFYLMMGCYFEQDKGEKNRIMLKLVGTRQKLLIRRMGLLLYDAVSIYMAALAALFIRFEMKLSDDMLYYLNIFHHYLIPIIIVTILLFWLCHLYSSLWTYAGAHEMVNIVVACVLASVAQLVIITYLSPFGDNMPRSFFVMYAVVLFGLACVSRFGYRALRSLANKRVEMRIKTNVMIVGAGDAGAALIREITNSKHINKKVVCAVDDSKDKIGNYIHGIKIVGDRYSIPKMVMQYDVHEIMVAMPTASPKETKAILDICKETGCKLEKLPGMFQLVNGEISISKLKDVDVNDLLGREPIKVNLDSIMDYVSDKVIMITGGGGSIGSELCRQVASHHPRQLILVDIYENTTYDIQNELRTSFPNLNLVVLIASVRNTKRIDQIFEKYRPNIVYHAAAHKHVPLMEDSPNEAVKNNVLGTWKVVKAADKWEVERFVMISTDKAVNPTNIMGATKRMCEMIIQTYDKRSKTEFVAVRFGNVLGSNGSVIPLFKRQIEQGGPVTVTHPDIIRYFMTIPEAVSLVLQAGAYAKGGEIFVLDMGEPVKILDLAKNLILLSGHKPDEDIRIEFTGLRPGEKLYEEMLMKEEGMQETDNKLIHIGKPIEMDEEKFMMQLENLKEYVVQEPDDIRDYVRQIVTTYTPKN